MNIGLTFIPKFVRQSSDLEYGDKVTHENYNEKLNLNTTQGDYNTLVLMKLLTCDDAERTYHIPYLDKALEEYAEQVDTFQKAIDTLTEDDTELHEAITNIDNSITHIVDGGVTVGHAQSADVISSGLTAGPSKYYGTDAESNLGFIDLPEFLYAIDMESSTGVDGVYYIPALNSVAEPMLSAEVREKLNREAVVDYDYLDNRPSINNVLLTGDKPLSDFGIQPVGDYITNASLTTTLADYSTTAATHTWVWNELASYATKQDLQTVNNALTITTSTANNALTTANACARVGVNSYVSNPKTGDLYFQV